MREHLGADIALIQTRDLYEKIPDLVKSNYSLLDRTKLGRTAAEDPENIQQTLDRLIWKGDLVTLLYVPGGAIRKALQQSYTYRAEETSTFSLAVEKGRQLEKLGVHEDNGEYFINDLPLDDKKIYAVATTDYVGAGDTGYPDLVKAALNPRTHPAAFAGELVPISSIVCRNLLPDPDKYCLGPVNGRNYLDESSASQIPPYKPQGWFSRLWETTGFKWPSRGEDATSTAGIIEQRVQRRGFWSFSLKNFSLGLKDLNNNRTDANIKEKFAGVPTSGVNAKESRTFNIAVDSRLSYFAHKQEFFVGSGVDFERQSTGEPPTEFSISQIRNKLFGDIGLVFWRRPGRAVPNLGAVFSVHGETQLQQPFSTFTLGTPAGDQKRISQGRSLLLLGRLGMRWQNKANSLEVGGQFGRETKALRGYRFENQGVVFECLVSSTQTLSDCIKVNSTPPGGLITVDSRATALLQGRPRAGIYLNHAFSIPFSAKVKYEVTQDADFFFINFHRDTTIDTRFRYQSKNRLSFMVWPNFSIGPTLDLLLYQNKVNRSFLFQRQFGIETKLSFEIFNRREKGAQIKQEP